MSTVIILTRSIGFLRMSLFLLAEACTLAEHSRAKPPEKENVHAIHQSLTFSYLGSISLKYIKKKGKKKGKREEGPFFNLPSVTDWPDKRVPQRWRRHSWHVPVPINQAPQAITARRSRSAIPAIRICNPRFFPPHMSNSRHPSMIANIAIQSRACYWIFLPGVLPRRPCRPRPRTGAIRFIY